MRSWWTIVVLAWMSACSETELLVPQPPVLTPDGVTFTYVDAQAKSVAVAGSFNDWSTDMHLMRQVHEDGLWQITIPLEPGEHLFMYVVDGKRWVRPPLADDYVPDGFGNDNGVVVVEEGGAPAS